MANQAGIALLGGTFQKTGPQQWARASFLVLQNKQAGSFM